MTGFEYKSSKVKRIIITNSLLLDNETEPVITKDFKLLVLYDSDIIIIIIIVYFRCFKCDNFFKDTKSII